ERPSRSPRRSTFPVSSKPDGACYLRSAEQIADPKLDRARSKTQRLHAYGSPGRVSADCRPYRKSPRDNEGRRDPRRLRGLRLREGEAAGARSLGREVVWCHRIWRESPTNTGQLLMGAPRPIYDALSIWLILQAEFGDARGTQEGALLTISERMKPHLL